MGFDIGDDLIRFVSVTMCNQPARAFRNPETHEKNQAGETGANQKSEPPAKIRIEKPWIKQDQRAKRAEGGPDPEAAVDDKVSPPAQERAPEWWN